MSKSIAQRIRVPHLALVAAMHLPLFNVPAMLAQDVKPTPRPRMSVVVPSTLWTPAADRAVLGVTLGASTRADTAGVRVDEVDANGPAAKAGLKAGDVITEVNGTNLRIAANDADDLALAGVAQRRLQRVMAKSKPGDDVELKVRSPGSAIRAVKVKTVSARDLEGTRSPQIARLSSRDAAPHAAIGVSIGASGSVRDTLGLFISSVVGGGPAEKAGVIEGERVAAVNGVDVRVPREDVDDGAVVSSRVDRFVKEVQKIAPGAPLTLRVYGNGRYREVSVTSVKSSDLLSQGWSMSAGDGGFQILRDGGPGAAMMFGRPLDGLPAELRARLEERGVQLRGIEPGRVQTPQIRIRAGLTRM